MKYVLIESAVVSKPAKKKYKCPYCDERCERQKLHIHIQNKHEDMIPEGYTALRVAFNTINHKTEGHCIICKEVTDWNEDKGRYERLCNKPECHEAYKKMAADRNRSKYGTDRLQTDPRYAEEVQKKALAGRKISGIYKFPDGGEIKYVGTYEKKFLEFIDQVMNCKSEDIQAPGPAIEYIFKGEKHLYLPDFFYIPYNLIIEIKDGGSNPNNHPKRIEEEEKIKAKEAAVAKNGKYSYVRVVDNDFSQLLNVMAVLKYQLMNNETDPVIRVNEITEDMSGTIAAALPLTPSPTPHEADKDNYYIIQHPQNNVFAYGITKDPVQNTIYGVDPLEKGFYKAYKTDKGKIDKKYLTFKIKDSQSAKELYDELAMLTKCAKSEFCDNRYIDSDYIYGRLTEGSKILTSDQLLFDNRFELVKNPNQEVEHICQEVYEYLKGKDNSDIDLLEEQVNLLEETNEYQDYNVLSNDVNNLGELRSWKDKFFSMPHSRRIISNTLSIELYGTNNLERYKRKLGELNSSKSLSLPDIARENDKHRDSSSALRDVVSEISNIISSDIPKEFYDNWDQKIQRVKEVEATGLIIMVVPNADEIVSYQELISILNSKWNQLQLLPANKRILSNQTASDIFGIDNNVLYDRLINTYTNCLNSTKDINLTDNPVDMTSLSPSIKSKNNNSSNTSSVEELCLKLQNTSDKKKREVLKEQISNLGWNPEIPYSKESAELAALQFESFLDFKEVDAETFLNEAAKHPKKFTSKDLRRKIVPVFVILWHSTNALFSRGIAYFTNSEWSHASLSFDSSLDRMYSFGSDLRSPDNKSNHSGFIIENKKTVDPNREIKLYALFITPEQKELIQEAVQWYIDNQDKTRYWFADIVNILLNRVSKSNNKAEMICSQFVYSILTLVGFKLKEDKNSALVTPKDIDSLYDDPRFFNVYQGLVSKCNGNRVTNICDKILPNLPLDLYGIGESGEIIKSTKYNSGIDKLLELAIKILKRK